ncbi:hypothetical protein RRG08_010152 [Elysia crispata]|uniref:Uncharacterized protein n=1 Tax=Elysia crispata TaxID=231223 RepID=A0AAE1AJK0_9GAST|nr:hypothetical protein RRG08_010152 [Elysia crispata]
MGWSGAAVWGVSNCSGAQGIEPLQHVQSSPQERLFPLKLTWKPGGGLLGHTEALALHWAMADTELWVIEQIICGKWNCIEQLQHEKSSLEERLFPLKLTEKPGVVLLGHTEGIPGSTPGHGRHRAVGHRANHMCKVECQSFGD